MSTSYPPVGPPFGGEWLGPLLILGETTFRNHHQRFGLPRADRLRHLWLLGKTGSGKSTLLENLIAQDLAQGTGFALLDPHGSLVEAVMPLIPRSRTNQVILFDPTDRDYPISFNVFRDGRTLDCDHARLSSGLVAIFKKLWASSWGPRLEHVLRNAILAVAGDPRATLLFLYRFLTDEHTRDQVVERISDPVVRQFWLREFPSYGRALQGVALAPVLNKLGAFVAHPLVRNIVGQERSRLSMASLIEGSGIILANLATGQLGEDASHLLGGLLMTSLQLAAMERRSAMPPFMIYADEFQHFVSESLATMLSESRKFGVGLILAHQYLGQLPEGLRAAVIGNIGSSIIFRLGSSDAESLAPEFDPHFTARDLSALPRYHAAMKLTVRSEILTPFSARTLPPPVRPAGAANLATLQAQSRQRYAQPRSPVEAAIRRSFPASNLGG